MPPLLNRAEVGVYSSPAHRDPTSVTELSTNGALQLLEERWGDEEQKKTRVDSEHLSSEPGLSLSLWMECWCCCIMRLNSRPLDKYGHGELIPAGEWALRGCSHSQTNTSPPRPQQRTHNLYWDRTRSSVNNTCYIMHGFCLNLNIEVT